jgi:hypothetical protein
MCLHSNVLHFSCTAIFSARNKVTTRTWGTRGLRASVGKMLPMYPKEPNLSLKLGSEYLIVNDLVDVRLLPRCLPKNRVTVVFFRDQPEPTGIEPVPFCLTFNRIAEQLCVINNTSFQAELS